MSNPKPRGEAWKNPEDVSLCMAVVAVGEDGDKATGQEKKKLWDRIWEVYEACKPPGSVIRSGGGCEAHWRKIRPGCTRWREALTKAEAAHASGENATELEVQARLIYRTLFLGEEFKFAHCWSILKDTEKFSKPPSLDEEISSGPSPIDLSGEDTPIEGTPSPSNVHARPPGQKAQRAAKKKCKEDNTSQLLAQMKRIADQGDRDLKHILQLREETRLAQERADDGATMVVDPSKFPASIRAYWERKQAMVIEREDRTNLQCRVTPTTCFI
ncbi:PREDICTED: uncharacterized protein LOC101297448 [Fragaria vesca subsp. vesca]